MGHPDMAAVQQRRSSRLERRLAAPRCLASTDGSHRSCEKSKRTESSRIEPASAESTSATSAVMAVVLAVGLAALRSGDTNTRSGER